MKMNIDLDKLKAEEAELVAKLQENRLMQTLVSKYAHEDDDPKLSEPEFLKKNNGNKEIKFMSSKAYRREVMVTLFTGPATANEIAKVLPHLRRYIAATLHNMLKEKLCFLTEHSAIKLTELGQAQAKWYIDNPGRQVCRMNSKNMFGLKAKGSV